MGLGLSPCAILESFTYSQQNTFAIQREASEIMLASGCIHFSWRQWPLYSHKESKCDVRGRSSGCNGKNLLLLLHLLNRTRERSWWYSIPLTPLLYTFNTVFIFPLLQDREGLTEQNQGLGFQVAVFRWKMSELCEWWPGGFRDVGGCILMMLCTPVEMPCFLPWEW